MRLAQLLDLFMPGRRRALQKRRLEDICRAQGASKAMATKIASAYFARPQLDREAR